MTLPRRPVPRRGARVRRTGLPARLRRRRAGGSLAPALGALVLATVLGLSGVLAAVLLATGAVLAALAADLPEPSRLERLAFAQPSVVYDRSGKVELGRFGAVERRVVAYEEIPELVLDATTTAEDRSFWRNEGYDPEAILAAVLENVEAGSELRGASTITQQLVRARLLPPDVVAPGSNVYVRKLKELIQAARLTEAYPGEAGKRRIVTAYLNEIYYGHGSYGIAAAARVYFGVGDLADLTPAQAALLAGLPKSPTLLDPYRFAREDAEGRLVVPRTAPPVVRRDWILRNLATSRWTRLSSAELRAALAEPVVLAGDRARTFRAPHFVWQVRRELERIVGGPEAVETGGFRVVTTLDWPTQALAQRWVDAAIVAPNLSPSAAEATLDRLKIPAADRRWIARLRGKDLHNAALVAIDYRTGDVLAYVGSAGYYRESLASAKFNPKYDAAGDAYRQPGSAFKPIVYATGFETRRLTPASLLLDVTTVFDERAKWAPRNADGRERGPVLARKALQYSLNVPAIRALQRVGSAAVAEQAERLGLVFQGGPDALLRAGLAGAIGTVEVRPIDLVTAYGALANAGQLVPRRTILEVRDASGRVVWRAPDPAPAQVIGPEAAYLVTDILAGNSDPRENLGWGPVLEIRNGPHGERRPIAAKTGTSNEARDLATYGYVAPPEDPDAPAYAVGLWVGNSDHSMPRTAEPATSLTAAAPLWRAFVRDLTDGTPVADFPRPRGVVRATADGWSGGAPGPWTRETVEEWFVAGTE
ncbi:MAG TPA: transglycosylase domain-containing protein, partial [Candidatus Limnocylindrales bacterium]|nr:transglycosylase domain-containing protein [Candidatus Limnocylindrales bacterium]